MRLPHDNDHRHGQRVSEDHRTNHHRRHFPRLLDPWRLAAFWPEQVEEEPSAEYGRYGDTDENVIRGDTDDIVVIYRRTAGVERMLKVALLMDVV